MDSLIDPVILATALIGSFAIAFMAQRAALSLIVKAMNLTRLNASSNR